MVRAGRHAQHDAGTPLRSVVVVCAGGSRMRAPFLSSFFSLGARFPMGRAGDAAGAALVGPSVCRERAAVAGVGGLPRPSDGIPSVPGRPPASRSSRCCPRSRERARAALNDALDASAACVGLARVFPDDGCGSEQRGSALATRRGVNSRGKFRWPDWARATQ